MSIKAELYKLTLMDLYENGHIREISDPVVHEEELNLFVNGEYLTTIPCSPTAYAELGTGYLISQGILKKEYELEYIECTEDGGLNIAISNIPAQINYPVLKGDSISQARIYTIADRVKNAEFIKDYKYQYHADYLLKLIHELDVKALTFKKTGGVHSAALGDKDNLIIRYEDIGRHNAVDKVFGYAFLRNISLHDKILVLSGRISSEIILKACMNGVPFILSRSAPTILAVEIAQEIGMTIVGFARDKRFNIYTHPQRIVK